MTAHREPRVFGADFLGAWAFGLGGYLGGNAGLAVMHGQWLAALLSCPIGVAFILLGHALFNLHYQRVGVR